MQKIVSLPPINPALVLSITMLEVERDADGMEACRTRRVGPMRFKLDSVNRALDEATQRKIANAMTVANMEAAILLAEMCRACPFTDCELKGWPITRGPSSSPPP